MPNKPVFVVRLPIREIKSIIGNPEKSAQAVNLIYVHDSEKGKKELKRGNILLISNKKQRSKIKLF